MRSALIVADEILVENLLHFVDGFEPCAASLDAEVLVQKRAMQALDDAVRLRAFDARGAVLDLLQLQIEIVGMLVGLPQNSRPLSDSTTSIFALCASKVGSTSAFIRCTAVTSSLLNYGITGSYGELRGQFTNSLNFGTNLHRLCPSAGDTNRIFSLREKIPIMSPASQLRRSFSTQVFRNMIRIA